MTHQYEPRDSEQLDDDGGYYTRHVGAMTVEGLYSKSDIAAELAWRDREIDRLKLQAQEASEPLWWHHTDECGQNVFLSMSFNQPDETPLYTHPAPVSAQTGIPMPSESVTMEQLAALLCGLECGAGLANASPNVLLLLGQTIATQAKRSAKAQETSINSYAPAIAAINFSLVTNEGITFLRLWNEAEFDAIRKLWPEAPEEIFIK